MTDDKIKKISIGVIALLILAAVIAIPVWLLINADDIGTNVATQWGTLAGTAKGYRNAPESYMEGKESGKEDALQAKNTTADMQWKITQTGKLEVMIAGTQVTNFEERPELNYAVLYSMKANAVFSVDLAQASFSFSEDGSEVTIILPQPQVELFYDEEGNSKIAEWAPGSAGSAEEGMEGHLNAREEVKKKTLEEFTSNVALMDSARKAAEKQVRLLVDSMTGNNKSVKIVFAQ